MNESILNRYWRTYGGFSALIKSYYLWISVVITAVLFPHWSSTNWWDDVLSIMPNLLGFSLGGYAMWIAIGDDNFRKLISGEDDDGQASPYMEVNAAFVHFIILQILSMLLGLTAKAYSFSVENDNSVVIFFGEYYEFLCLAGYSFSYFIFIYALLSALAATLALLRVSSWYDKFQSQTPETKLSTDEEILKELKNISQQLKVKN
ncbi:hypothetical protein [Thalassotalea sediminis]|uniref:hypothetical protein n=1 Tax=Thalassotalea sediminis TaxID=1759089 RepID=UPI002572FF65|nr:hypothetical protein [Thalassotalea sediminis]